MSPRVAAVGSSHEIEPEREDDDNLFQPVEVRLEDIPEEDREPYGGNDEQAAGDQHELLELDQEFPKEIFLLYGLCFPVIAEFSQGVPLLTEMAGTASLFTLAGGRTGV